MSKKESNPPPPRPSVQGIPIQKHLDLLGHKVKDKVTDYKGVVISMSFDLYGCIQADVRPTGLNEKGKPTEGWWLDVNRLIVTSKVPVMEPPNFTCGDVAEGRKGPANLPPKI